MTFILIISDNAFRVKNIDSSAIATITARNDALGSELTGMQSKL